MRLREDRPRLRAEKLRRRLASLRDRQRLFQTEEVKKSERVQENGRKKSVS